MEEPREHRKGDRKVRGAGRCRPLSHWKLSIPLRVEPARDNAKAGSGMSHASLAHPMHLGWLSGVRLSRNGKQHVLNQFYGRSGSVTG